MLAYNLCKLSKVEINLIIFKEKKNKKCLNKVTLFEKKNKIMTTQKMQKKTEQNLANL